MGLIINEMYRPRRACAYQTEDMIRKLFYWYFLSHMSQTIPQLVTYLFFQLFTTQSRLLPTPRMEAFENILGKGENAANQHFLLFPKC